MLQTVCFRVDSSSYMGTGHLMRCLTLAVALKDKGAHVTFICRDLPGNFSEKIITTEFELCLLSFNLDGYEQKNYQDEYAFWLAVPWLQDADETLREIDSFCDLLIVDHYGLDYQWEQMLRSKCKKIMAIDDLANRRHDCDFLLDHNFYVNAQERYSHLVAKNCIQMCGPTFALIAPEILQARAWREQHYKLPENDYFHCLVFMGGADAGSYSQLIVDNIFTFTNNVVVKLVLGLANPKIDEIKNHFQNNPRIEVLVQPKNYYQLLAECDFVVGAGGVSVLERFCIGVPAFVFQVADNQAEICHNLTMSQGAVFLGKVPILNNVWIDLMKNISKKDLSVMGQAGRKLVDGNAIVRILEQIYEN